MINYTLTNLTTDLRDFAENHSQIYEFGFGNISNISTKDTNYILMWIIPSTSTSHGAQFLMSFDVYILDLEKQDHSNLETIMNETLLVMNDLDNYFKHSTSIEYQLYNDLIYEPFSFRFDDVLTGYKANIQLELTDSGNPCTYIPTN